MKENKNDLGLNKDSVSKEFEREFKGLKEKVVALRDSEDNARILRADCKDYADKFVEKFCNDKAELGKIVSWLGHIYSRDELIAILKDYVVKGA